MANFPGGGTVIADESGFAKTFYGLRRDGFYAADFADFAIILEHLVLSTIAFVPSSRSVPSSMLEVIRDFISEGAIHYLERPAPSIWDPPQIKNGAQPDGLFNPKRSGRHDALCEASRIASAELHYSRPGLVQMRQREAYSSMARPRDEHLVCDLMKNHKRLFDALQDLKQRGRPPAFISLSVPPFARLILTQARNFDEVIDLTIKYRRKCARLREAEGELYDVVHSSNTGVIERLEAQKKFLSGWDKMVEACGEVSSAKMEFANSKAHFLRHLRGAFFAVIEQDASEGWQELKDGAQKLMESLSSDEWEDAHPLTLRPVRSAAWAFLTKPDREIYEAAQRILGVPIEQAHKRLHLLPKRFGASTTDYREPLRA